MDLTLLKQKIVEFLTQYKEILIKNLNAIILVILIGVIIYLTYFYSEKRRVKGLLKHIDNNYIYDKPRLTYDFCGVDTGAMDSVYLSNVTINAINNTLTIDPNQVDFHKLGLSSEYFIDIVDKKNTLNNNPSGSKYKIKRVIDKNTIEFHPSGHKLTKIDDFVFVDGTNDKKVSLIKLINDDALAVTLQNEASTIKTIFDSNKGKTKLEDIQIGHIETEISSDISSTEIDGSLYITEYKQSNIKLDYFKPSDNTNKFKRTKLADYYVSSSYRSFLIGHQILDYCNINMIYKSLYYGARYIELEIFDKDKRADTIPVVYAGYNDGMTSLNLNSLDFNECIKTISKIAFSERHLENYNEPLFLFLNIKTENYRTQDKIYDSIQLYLKRFLLDKNYNHINMGEVRLCELKRKCVLFASKNYNASSKLNSIINSAVDRGGIKRITYNEALLTADEFQGAKYSIMSSNISFLNGFNDYIMIEDPNINLLRTGLTSGDIVQISGAEKPKNNSGEYEYKITQVTQNKLVVDKSIRFMKEGKGALVTIKGYDKDRKMEALEDYNKNRLTIVIPDNRLTSHNQNYENIFYRGCQFVAMNFQYPDEFMLNYFDFFKQKSFSMKPAYLLANVYVPKTPSLNSMVPKLETKLRVNVDYTFFDRIKNNGKCIIKSFIDSSVRLINDDRVAKLSISNDIRKSTFVIKRGLNGKSGYISIESTVSNIKRFLCYNDSCCYLYFHKIDPTKKTEITNKMKEYASFIPIHPLENNKGFNSIGVLKEKIINRKQTDVLYYIKSRQAFSTRNILYSNNKTEYSVKAFLVNNKYDSIKPNLNQDPSYLGVKRVAILKPKFSKNGKYFPVGDIFIDVEKLDTITDITTIKPPDADDCSNYTIIFNSIQKIKTKLFSGAVDKPIDYELIWDNKNYPDVVKSELNYTIEDIIKNTENLENKFGYTEDTLNGDLGGIKGLFYRGCQNKTKSGLKCLKWSEENKADGKTGYPLKGAGADSVKYQALYGVGNHNYCRNPYGGGKLHKTHRGDTDIWCYTEKLTEEGKRFELCEAETETNNTPLSIWRPIPNEGYMAAGVVCMNSYDKPSINDVVCISVDYLSESNIVEKTPVQTEAPASGATTAVIDEEPTPTAIPLWCDEDSQLILWSNLKHHYAQPDTIIRPKIIADADAGAASAAGDAGAGAGAAGAAGDAGAGATTTVGDKTTEYYKTWGGVYPPNVIDFKMYKFILDEKDYNDRLYLDSIIIDKKSKEDTLFQFIEQKDKKEPGSSVYDYFLKKENNNGKFTSYTKSLNGGKMCMALPQPYWSLFYNETQDTSGKTEEEKQKLREELTNEESRLRFEPCKDRDYFGTNWNYYKDKTIRLEDNKDYCVTYNTNDKDELSTDINDSDNYLYLTECNSERKNQKFLYEKNNLKVYTGTNYEPNACLTHTPTDDIRLEECGDRKYTAVWKWQKEINRVDKCSRLDVEDELKKIGTMEQCVNNSYYVAYLKTRFEIHNKEYCSRNEAYDNYDTMETQYPLGVAIIHNKNILKQSSMDASIKLIFKNYATELASKLSECSQCEYASKILCSDKSILESDQNHYENDEDKTELSKYCMDMKNNNSFKCDRHYRQKFFYKPKSNDFCLGLYKPVYIAIENNETKKTSTNSTGLELLDINLNRIISGYTTETGEQQYPFDNLLGETYDLHYHIFIKGILAQHPTSDYKFRVMFDIDNLKDIGQNYIDIEKSDTRIILDYQPDYNKLKKGDKVIVRDKDKNIISNDDNYAFSSYKLDTKNVNLKRTHVRWMGVVIKKLNNNRVKVMHSINSYESNHKLKDEVEGKRYRPFRTSNPISIYDINELILYKKAPLCL